MKLLQNIKEKPDSDDCGIRGDPARDLGTLHHICVTHLKDLQVMAKSKVKYYEIIIVSIFWGETQSIPIDPREILK